MTISIGTTGDDNQSNLHVYVDRCKHYVQAEDEVGNSVLVCAEHQSPRAGAILTLCLCKEGGKGEESCGVAERGGGIWCGIPRQVPQPILNREHVYFYLALEMTDMVIWAIPNTLLHKL